MDCLKIELGSGGRKREGWVGVDKAENADLRCDLETDCLPFADASVDEIYSSHFLEHFYHKDLAGHVLPECLRVLKPGGVFSAAVPDASIYVRAYNANMPCPEVISIYKKAYFWHSPIDALNYIAYMGGQHRHMFDRENLVALLEACGFADVRGREFDPEMDIPARKAQSIYCIARKRGEMSCPCVNNSACGR